MYPRHRDHAVVGSIIIVAMHALVRGVSFFFVDIFGTVFVLVGV